MAKTNTKSNSNSNTKTRSGSNFNAKTKSDSNSRSPSSGTKTQDFGSSKREGHDSTRFYSSKLYENLKIDEKQEIIDNSDQLNLNTTLQTLFANSQKISKLNEDLLNTIPNQSLQLIIARIPDLDKKPSINNNYLEEWIKKIGKIIEKLKDKLITGGRLVLIVNNEIKDSKTYFPLNSRITRILLDNKFILRGNIILTLSSDPFLNESNRQSKKNENVTPKRLLNNYMIAVVACKDVLKRLKKIKKKETNSQKTVLEKTDTIDRDQFLSYTKSIWHFEPELINPPQKHEILPMWDYIHRFLHLFSFKEDYIMLIANDTPGNFIKAIRSKLILANW